MYKVWFLLLYLFSVPILSVETEGRLSFPEASSITVGEVFRAELLLLPFEERLITEKTLEGKDFLGLFYISRVNSIKTSKNNYDAVVVDMDLILPKKFEPQELYIWQLGDRNIPVQIEGKQINDVTLNAKNFIVYSPPPVDFNEFDWNYFGLLIVTLILLGLVFYSLRKSRAKKKSGTELDYRSLLSSVNSHKDLEEIYKIRREIFVRVNAEESKEKLNNFFDKYKWEQFRPEWKNQEIQPLLDEARELAGEINNGV